MKEETIKQYLEQVIARVDFINPSPLPLDSLPTELTSEIMKSFPIAEPREIIAEEFQIKGAQEIETTRSKMTEWNFYGKNRERRLCISKEFILVVFKQYTSFKELQDIFIPIVKTLFAKYNGTQGRRLGLRYINKIKKGDQNYFEWEGELNKNLLAIFEVPKAEEKNNISRAFHNLILHYDDFDLRFQYGMHNPDFPAPIRQKLFILDFDAYSNSLIQGENIETKLDTLHEKIKDFLSKC
jgi:uncharacterized protein (TIGR04255 family)